MKHTTHTVCVVARGAGWHAWTAGHEVFGIHAAEHTARECAAKALRCAADDVVLEPIAGAEGVSYRAWQRQSTGAFLGELAATAVIAGALVLAAAAGLLWIMDGGAR